MPPPTRTAPAGAADQAVADGSGGTDTLVVSDLHLGSGADMDLLRVAPAVLDRLVGALAGVRRLVLAGDVLELRHGPPHLVLDRARPVLRAIGAALGPDAEVVLLAGNHDHRLVRPWLEARRAAGEPLGAAHVVDPAVASPLAAATAEALGGAGGPSVRVAHPGLWIVPPHGPGTGVWATHGNLVDAVWRMPTFERMLSAAMGDRLRMPPRDADDLEALLAPGYAWLDGAAEHRREVATIRSQQVSSRVWGTLQRRRSVRGAALRPAVAATIRTLGRAGLGDLEPRLTPDTLRIAGLRGIARVAAILGIAPAHAIFGHTHRAGPLPGDAAWEWRLETGGRLWNSGSWVADPGVVTTPGPRSPYHPGHAVAVGADGVPRGVDLLDGLELPA